MDPRYQGPPPGGDEIPAWAESMVHQVMERQQATLSQQQDHFQGQLRALQEQFQTALRNTSTAATAAPTPVVQAVPTAATQASRRPRPKLPDPERFDGSDLTLFPQFLSQLKAKLRLDQEAIGGEIELLWYGFNRLGGKAAARIHPWIAATEPTPDFTLEKFYDRLCVAFLDSTLQEQALARLNTLRQGNRPASELIAELDVLLLEAGGNGWEDRVKKGYLKSALNRTIEDRLVNIEEKEDYTEFCRQVQDIAQRLANLRRIEPKPWVQVPSQQPSNRPSTSTAAPTEPMDWEPTAKTASTRRAKWVGREELERRKRDKLCLRCGATGHVIKGCPFQAARRPQQAPSQSITAAQVSEAMLEEEEEAPPETGNV